jgi:hypothetical protein
MFDKSGVTFTGSYISNLPAYWQTSQKKTPVEKPGVFFLLA